MGTSCFHCGSDCESHPILFDEKPFCCNGCKTVYEIFSENNLTCYYDLERSPGAIPQEISGKYNFLDNQAIVEKLLEFNDANVQIITLYIPHIHCRLVYLDSRKSSKVKKGYYGLNSRFSQKNGTHNLSTRNVTLKELVLLLSSIGYEPYISLENYEGGKKRINRSIIYKLGVAGFAFGNVMLLSFPEYFEVDEFWLNQYKPFFRWIMFALSLPVVF